MPDNPLANGRAGLYDEIEENLYPLNKSGRKRKPFIFEKF